MRRLTRMTVVMGLLWLCLGSWRMGPLAEAATDLQLCGWTQFADFVIIGAQIQEGSRLIIPSSWIQLVPNLYSLLGSGVIIRDPLEPQRFLGGLTIVNTTDLFGGNPSCAVSQILTVDDPDLPSYAATATLSCIGGVRGPFQVTLAMTLLSCQEPGFPVSTSTEKPMSREEALETIHTQGQTAAGEAQNNELR